MQHCLPVSNALHKMEGKLHCHDARGLWLAKCVTSGSCSGGGTGTRWWTQHVCVLTPHTQDPGLPQTTAPLFIPYAPAPNVLSAASCDFRQTRAVGGVQESVARARSISRRPERGQMDSSPPRCTNHTSSREWSSAPRIKDMDDEGGGHVVEDSEDSAVATYDCSSRRGLGCWTSSDCCIYALASAPPMRDLNSTTKTFTDDSDAPF